MGLMAKFTELMLTALQYQAEGALTMLDFLLSATDPAEMRRRLHCPGRYERTWFSKSWAEMYRDRQQFYNTLNYLKNQGLVVKRNVKKKTRWILTPEGAEKAARYRKSRNDPLSFRSIDFSPPSGLGITIVAFDIPERERRKRDWIRACLVAMGFDKLQKSVWVTRGTVDEDFMHALRERDLLHNVHIFSVTKQGTIHRGAR